MTYPAEVRGYIERSVSSGVASEQTTDRALHEQVRDSPACQVFCGRGRPLAASSAEMASR